MLYQLLFWSSILIGGLGLSTIIISFFLAVKYTERLLTLYSIFLLLLEALFFIQILELYSGIADFPFFSSDSAFNIISYNILVFIISVYLPCFILRLTGGKIKSGTIPAIVIPPLFYPAGLFIYYSSYDVKNLSAIADILFFLIISGWLIYLIYKKPYTRKGKMPLRLKTLILLILIFTPFLVTDIILPAERHSDPFPGLSAPLFIFILLWNILNLFLAYRIFFLPSDRNPLMENVKPFSAAYRLSPREEEITSLIIRGESNKNIACTLKISERTVKNHIYSVFRKTGVQSRTELFVKLYSHNPASDTAVPAARTPQ